MPQSSPHNHPPTRGARAPLALLSIILFAEAALLAAVLIWLAWELVTEQPTSIATAIALFVVVLIGAVWVTAVAVGSVRRQPWVRGGALTWQVLQIAAALGAFQGLFARPDVGWALLIPAVVAIVLLFTPAVRDALARPGESGYIEKEGHAPGEGTADR